MVPLACALLLAGQELARPIQLSPPEPRFQTASPLPGISGLMMDAYNDGMGLAQQWARAKHLQGRVLWIDGTANLERVNTEDKINSLVAKIAGVGFNTIVFDIKPISGQVLYKSRIAPKIETWRNQSLPPDFDPLPAMVREAHRHHLQILVSMNAFSEGHSLFKVGPGYGQPSWQSVLYAPIPVVRTDDGREFEASSTINVMPGSDGVLHLFSDRAKYHNDKAGIFTVTVASNGVVQDGFEAGGVGANVPTIPDGGYLIAARGQGAAYLKQHALPGAKIYMGSRAEFVKTAEHPDQYPLMMNPNSPEVQTRALAIMHEVVSQYAVDGVLYDDRLRYAGMNADFSELSRSEFEAYVGKKLNWPDDVFSVTFSLGLKKGLRPGRYYDAWMLWRSLQMRNWVARVHNEVKKTRPGAAFGIYAGSWFGEYPAFGSNYGGPNLEAGFWFLTPKYQKTGFANLLDLVITGCYYPTPTIYQAMVEGKPTGSTVEAAGQLTNRVVDDQCWAYAGIDLSTFKNNPSGLENALQAACGCTQGVMVFDLSHDIEPMWQVFARAFRQPANPPHANRLLLAKVRGLRANYRAMGARERPVVISAGSSGAGF